MELQNIRRIGASCLAWLLRRKSRRRGHILVIRRNRMGDMICTLPLLDALRHQYPRAHLAVACDAPGVPIAMAFPAVNETILLEGGGLLGLFKNARRLQGFDWIIVAKGGFDRRLAWLARLSSGARCIGFERPPDGPSLFYTDPVEPVDVREHQVETLLRLLSPMGFTPSPDPASLRLTLPKKARMFAAPILSAPPFSDAPRFLLLNISSTSRLRFRPDDFMELIARILKATDWAVGIVSAPVDQLKSRELAARSGSDRVRAVATPGTLELAALLEPAALFITPEGGAAHLATVTGTPAVVIWSEGPFDKWHSRGENHVFVQAAPDEEFLSVDRVWQAVEPLLGKNA